MTPERHPVDARIDSPQREGLTGTTPATVFGPLNERESITIPPDWRPSDAQPAWRRDFPIDWPEDHYVERRDFMKFMVLTSLAFTVGQFWIAVQNFLRRRRGAPELSRLTSVTDIAVGATREFAYPTEHDPCVLVRSGDQTFVAYSQKCTHLSCAVLPDVEHGVIRCPCHEGVFDLGSGRPIAGPPRRPLARVRLEVHGGDLFAAGMDEKTV